MMWTKILAAAMALMVCAGAAEGDYTMARGYRTRQTLVVEPRAGVDYTSSALDIAPGRATDMSNLVGVNGVLRKRHGWRQVVQLCAETDSGPAEQRVNSMTEFGGMLYVHAGDALYRVDADARTAVNIGAVPGIGGIDDCRTEGVVYGGRLYLIGGGVIPVVDAAGTVGALEDSAYIPTTTVGINDNTSDVDSRAILDDVNLLTVRRRNKGIGLSDEDIGGSFVIDYQLDTTVDSEEVGIEIETMVEEDGVEVIRTFYIGCGKDDWGYGAATLHYLNEDGTQVENVGPAGVIRADGTVSLYTFNYQWEYEMGLYDNLVQPDGFSFEPAAEGVDNITFTFSHTPAGGNFAERITEAKFGLMFGADGAADRLFLGGIPGFPNRLYYSEAGDLSYWSDLNYISCGSDYTEIVGMSRISDGVMAVHKAGNAQEPTIYYVSGENRTEYDGDVLVRMYAEFRTVAGNVGESVVSRDACRDFLGDHLILTRSGVHAVTLRENVATNDRHLVERSRSIRTVLQASDLTDAFGIVFDGRYWLSVGDTVYTADSQATYDSEAGQQYEWYKLDGIGARVLCECGDRLYFGRADGRVCVFTEDADGLRPYEAYADRTESVIGAGDVTINYASSVITINADAIRGCERMVFDSDLCQRLLDAGNFTVDEDEDGCFVILNDQDDIADYVTGERLILDGDTAEAVRVQDIDRGRGTFRLYHEDNEYIPLDVSEEARLLRPLAGRELDVRPAASGAGKQLILWGMPLLLDVAGGYENYTGGDMTGHGIHNEPVTAEWYSQMTDLGTNQLEKTLLCLTVATEPTRNGQLSVGYETRNADGLFGSRGIGGLDLGELDFNDFTLVGYASSFTQRINVRHVNFVRLRFRSVEAAPCCVHNLTLTYTVTGVINGGR